MKWPLRDIEPSIVPIGSVGDFAFKRSFYYHPGIDIYCPVNTPVQAMEDGKIVHIEHFTGENANPPSPWWKDTWSVMVEGESGVIGYCEVSPNPLLDIGSEVKEGDQLAIVIPVLKKDKGNGTTMLHLEHYIAGTRQHVTWVLWGQKPPQLLDPRPLLERVSNAV